MKKAFKKILSILLRVGISVALLVFVFRRVDERQLLATIKNADKGLLFWAFIVFASGYILCLLRWEMLLKAVKIHIPLKRVIISFAGGIFFNLFLPSTIGGDLVRSIDLSAHTQRPREVVATVLLDRLSGYIGLVILTLFSLFLGSRFLRDSSIFLSVTIIIGILVVVMAALFNKFLFSKINRFLSLPNAGKLREAVKNLHAEIHVFRHKKKVIINNLILSFLIQCTTPLSFFIISRALGLRVHLIYFFIFLPIIGAITLLPISIGGLGLRDATTIFFFAKAGVGKDLAFAMSLLNFFFIVICASLGGLIYVLTLRHRRIQHHQPSPIHPPAA